MTHANADARAAANTLVALIQDECERVEIAGSIRRGKAEVKDAELVVIPRAGLWPLLDTLVARGVVDKARYGDKGTTRWGDKYRGVMVDGVKVEIFAADAVNWGYQLWLRTGPGDANTHVMKWRSFTQRTATWEPKDGYIHDAASSARLIVPDEATMFAILGTAYIPPNERTLSLYESIFKRGHVWGDVSHLARADAKALPTVAPKYPVSSEKPYSPLYAVGEVVTFDGVRYAVEKIVCHMRKKAVSKGQPLEYLLKRLDSDFRAFVWEYLITPVVVVETVAPSAPVAALVPERVEPLLLPSCDLRPLRDAVRGLFAENLSSGSTLPRMNGVNYFRIAEGFETAYQISLGGKHWCAWQPSGVVIYQSAGGGAIMHESLFGKNAQQLQGARYFSACSFDEFTRIFEALAREHGIAYRAIYSSGENARYADTFNMPAGAADAAYRRWRVEQRVNRAQLVTATPDVICLTASMTAPVDATEDDYIAALSNLCAWIQSATVRYFGELYVIAYSAPWGIYTLLNPDKKTVLFIHHSYFQLPPNPQLPSYKDYDAFARKAWGISEGEGGWRLLTPMEDDSNGDKPAPVDAFAAFVETLLIDDAPEVDRLAGLREFSGLCAWVAYATGQRLVDGWLVTMEHKNRHFATLDYRFVIRLNGEQVLVSNTGGLPDPRQPLVVDEVRAGDAAPDGAVQLALF